MDRETRLRNAINAGLGDDVRAEFQEARELITTRPSHPSVANLRNWIAHLVCALYGEEASATQFLGARNNPTTAVGASQVGDKSLWLNPLNVAIARGHPENLATLLHYTPNAKAYDNPDHFQLNAKIVGAICGAAGIPEPNHSLFEAAINYAFDHKFDTAATTLFSFCFLARKPEWTPRPVELAKHYPAIRDYCSKQVTSPETWQWLQDCAVAFIRYQRDHRKNR